jgi:hypothetical protein
MSSGRQRSKLLSQRQISMLVTAIEHRPMCRRSAAADIHAEWCASEYFVRDVAVPPTNSTRPPRETGEAIFSKTVCIWTFRAAAMRNAFSIRVSTSRYETPSSAEGGFSRASAAILANIRSVIDSKFSVGLSPDRLKRRGGTPKDKARRNIVSSHQDFLNSKFIA